MSWHNSKSIGWAICVSLAIATVPSTALAVSPIALQTLDIGESNLSEKREQVQVSPGVTLHKITRGHDSSGEEWVAASLPLRSVSEVNAVASCLAAAGVKGVSSVKYPAPGSPGDSYTIIHFGAFASEKEVKASFTSLPAGCEMTVQPVKYTPLNAQGPWRINILEIDPDSFDGRLSLALANNQVGNRATVSSMSKAHGALAGINGGFFTMHQKDGLPGDPSGLLIADNRVMSDPIQGRYVLVFGGEHGTDAKIYAPAPTISLRQKDKTELILDGVNRLPGTIRFCGNIGDTPTEAPLHDETCYDKSEIILITRDFSLKPEAFSGAVTKQFKSSENYLVATGERIKELDRLPAEPSLSLDAIIENVRTKTGISSPLSALTGAPILVLDGKPTFHEDTEGWPIDPPTTQLRANFVHHWLNIRNPRTAVAVTQDKRILLVTIDGRELVEEGGRTQVNSVGATIGELRDLMMSLEARDAINLDGGGSTTMVVGGKLANSPSDRQERAISDAILVLPK